MQIPTYVGQAGVPIQDRNDRALLQGPSIDVERQG